MESPELRHWKSTHKRMRTIDQELRTVGTDDPLSLFDSLARAKKKEEKEAKRLEKRNAKKKAQKARRQAKKRARKKRTIEENNMVGGARGCSDCTGHACSYMNRSTYE